MDQALQETPTLVKPTHDRCTSCGDVLDAGTECPDRVRCWSRITIGDFLLGRISPEVACERLLTCSRVALDPATAELAGSYARSIEREENDLRAADFALMEAGRRQA